MLSAKGYAISGPTAALEPFEFERRDPGPEDVLIEIEYCGPGLPERCPGAG
jgi:uncharacterized zinc-type alcohol dehydrogenase-like protein